MNRKQLTISIAAYNVEHSLAEALDSVTVSKELGDALEILVIDDGSTDGTPEIARNYEEQYPDIIHVIHKVNGGYGSTVNYAVRIAQGRYFKLIDGDDIADTEGLERLIEFLSTTEADLVLTPWVCMREGTKEYKLIDKHRKLSGKPIAVEAAEFGDALSMFEICARTDMLRNYGIRLTEHYCYTDNEFVAAVDLAATTVVRFPEPVYRYRLGVLGQSISIEGQRRHFREYPVVCANIFALIDSCQQPIEGGRRFLIERLTSTLTRCVYASYMVQKSPLKYRTELMTWDAGLKENYPKLYEQTSDSKLVSMARTASPIVYRLICMKVTEWEENKSF